MGGDACDITVRCGFRDCDPNVVLRVVMAAVDQLCAEYDIDIALLDALDVPLGESIEALDGHGIEAVELGFSGRELVVVIQLENEAPSLGTFLGDSDGLVASFFDIETSAAAAQVKLTGSLS